MPEEKHALARSVLINAIRPALNALVKGGRAAEQLVLGTAIQESLLIHRQQLGGGPALGLFQIEPRTHDDCWGSYLRFRSELAERVRSTLKPGEQPLAQIMKVNDVYAAAMCRICYVRVKPLLPSQDDIPGMANYWKQHYNTPLGAGSPHEFLTKWPQYVNAHTFD